MILAHELAHVRRHDMWVNLLQRLAEIVLFFNPPLWYLSRRIASLREYCCDELACREQSPPDTVRLDYATALLRVIELAQPCAVSRHDLAVLAASGRSPSEVRRRVARLLGEPLSEPLCVSRGRLIAAAAVAVAVIAGPRLLPSVAQTADNAATTNSTDYPPPPTESDRSSPPPSRTFGLQSVPRISLRQTYWNADVVAMQEVPEETLPRLWQARGQAVDQSMRRKTTSATTLAWDGEKLLFQTDSNITADATVPSSLSTQSRYWDGSEGWLEETYSGERHIFRYTALGDLMKGPFFSLYFPQWTAAGGCLCWGGPKVVLEQFVQVRAHAYKHAGTETVDGVQCDVYDGPARMERLWIEKPTGLVKATCRQYVHKTLPNYYTELIREVAGRTFADAIEYRQWAEKQPADVRAKLAADWSAAHWPGSEPGNLSVFSDYREIAPGVRWPMHCERIAVLPAGNNRADDPVHPR